MNEVSEPVYVCPACHSRLSRADTDLRCSFCRRSHPVEDGIADFVSGEYYDQFTPGARLSDEERAGLEHEIGGATPRIRDFYVPRIGDARRLRGRTNATWRVLDCGCGNGISIDVLNEAGVAAWGNDPSAMRKWQWRERKWRERLCVADGSSLPFPDGFFDAVLASGVLEHVGVAESRTDRYEVRPLPSRDADRRRFVAELFRVTAPDGTIWLDFPNGAFPIDFWHGDRPGAARGHGPREGFLPTPAEIRRLVQELSEKATVHFHSPHRRLGFRQVRGRWYGALLSAPARLLLLLMTARPFRFLAATGVNPFLVVEIRRRELSESS
jgi:SAM-dependent methyltransferase